MKIARFARLTKNKRWLCIAGLSVLFAGLLAIVLPVSITHGQRDAGPDVLPPEFASQVPQEIKDNVLFLSGRPSLIAAKALGITEIAGRPVPKEDESDRNDDRDELGRGVPIGADPAKIQNEPTVAANPKNRNNLVAGMHSIIPGVRCVAFNSFDGGQTWSGPILMPQLTPRSSCSDPVLAFAQDGSRVYYAYMDIRFEFTPSPPTFTRAFSIVVNFSDDGGRNWLTTPVVALAGKPTIIRFNPPPNPPTIEAGFDYDKPWIATHVDERESSFVYVTATKFDNFAPFLNHIAFTRSAAKSAVGSWSAPTILDSSFPNPPLNRVLVQGSMPAGGMGGNVVVAWYHSNGPGLTVPPDPIGWLNNSFIIRTRYSPNHGDVFGSVVNASVDSFEAPFFLGPFASFHRWWGTMFPNLKIARNGSAHLVYTHHPVRNLLSPFVVFPPPPFRDIRDFSATSEDGDIRYISSAGPPYTAWSTPVTVNDDGLERAQGFPALAIQDGQGEDSKDSKVFITFFDARLSRFGNLTYDIFGTSKRLGDTRFRRNFRVSDRSSISHFSFIGDYFGLTSSGDLVYQVWTDRRKYIDGFLGVFQSDVFGIRVDEQQDNEQQD